MRAILAFALFIVVCAGCQRERYQAGNVPAPSEDNAPAYSHKADPNVPTQ